MAHVRKLVKPPFGKWVSSLLSQKPLLSSKAAIFSSIRRRLQMEHSYTFYASVSGTARARKFSLAEAQRALLDYLHNTRSLSYIDAEHISKNSPTFLQTLIEKVEDNKDVARSLSRFLRYHPINEFEPFLESLGLKPAEFSQFLPSNLMFLCDDVVMFDNYHVLCDYGIPRGRIGEIYKDAAEVFRYDYGVLASRLVAFENLGLSKRDVIKLVLSCPPLLRSDDVKRNLVEVLEKLKSFDLDVSWFSEYLSEKDSYDWNRMLAFLCILDKMGLSKKEIQEIISRHPDLLWDRSGRICGLIVTFYVKLGVSINQMKRPFLQLPQINIGTFAKNLQQGLTFLYRIELQAKDIGEIVQAFPVLLGSCTLMKPKTVRGALKVGKKQLCKIVKDDPNQLKKWVVGAKLTPRVELSPIQQKINFLLGLGFTEDCPQMKKALKLRGKGCELQERFDCLVEAGLDPKDVLKMMKTAPQILNMKKVLLQEKIDCLINEGYPLSSLMTFPACMTYTISRIKLRVTMYNWLKGKGKVNPGLALSSILACSEKIFVKYYVRHHPEGPRIWDEFKKVFCQIKK